MKRHMFMDPALIESSAASRVITLQFSTASGPKINWLSDLLAKVCPVSATFWFEVGQGACERWWPGKSWSVNCNLSYQQNYFQVASLHSQAETTSAYPTHALCSQGWANRKLKISSTYTSRAKQLCCFRPKLAKKEQSTWLHIPDCIDKTLIQSTGSWQAIFPHV